MTTISDFDQDEGIQFSIEDVFIILKRRLLYFVLPVLVIIPLGVIAVMLLPAKYTAQGTILVESQQIPTELVRSTINSYAQERIQTIRQRVMTRNRLLEVADEYDLFPKSLGLSESERVRLMRQRLRVDLITTSNRGSGDGTIAFTVSYTDGDSSKAYRVANKFMTLFLDEDVRARTAGASNTTEFFVREASRLRELVANIEGRISTFKAENADALPEHLDLHLATLERLRSNLAGMQTQISQLEEEKRFLETQLISGVATENPLTSDLARLEAELARLRATYHETYPAIASKKEEIASIRRQLAPDRDIEQLRFKLVEAESQLRGVERAPDVSDEAITAAEAEVEKARVALSDRIAEESRKSASDLTGVQLEGRIAIINNRIRTIGKQTEQTEEQIAALDARIARIPEVERGLSALTRDYDNVFREYQDVLAKQQDAQLAENLEENQQAEKFSILEPALAPEEPSSPNRTQLIFLVIVAGFAAGGVLALGAEFLFAAIRGRDHLASVMDEAPIAVIPIIVAQKTDKKRRVHAPIKSAA